MKTLDASLTVLGAACLTNLNSLENRRTLIIMKLKLGLSPILYYMGFSVFENVYTRLMFGTGILGTKLCLNQRNARRSEQAHGCGSSGKHLQLSNVV